MKAIRKTEDNANVYTGLINLISSDVHQNIAEPTTYESAMRVLDASIIKRQNIVCARHITLISNQAEDKNISSFVIGLNQSTKDCKFNTVTAEQYRKSISSFKQDLCFVRMSLRPLIKNLKIAGYKRRSSLLQAVDAAAREVLHLNAKQVDHHQKKNKQFQNVLTNQCR